MRLKGVAIFDSFFSLVLIELSVILNKKNKKGLFRCVTLLVLLYIYDIIFYNNCHKKHKLGHYLKTTHE